MVASSIHFRQPLEDVVAKLADAAYQVVLQRGLKEPFLDVELSIWRHLRFVFFQGIESAASDRTTAPRSIRQDAEEFLSGRDFLVEVG